MLNLLYIVDIVKQNCFTVLYSQLQHPSEIGFRYSFICQVRTSTRRQQRDLSVFESSCHLLLPAKVEAIPLSALPNDTTSELAGLSPH